MSHYLNSIDLRPLMSSLPAAFLRYEALFEKPIKPFLSLQALIPEFQRGLNPEHFSCHQWKRFLLLLLAIYEVQTDRGFEDLEPNDWFLMSQNADMPAEILKHKFFSFLKPELTVGRWLDAQDEALRETIRLLYPEILMNMQGGRQRIDWKTVSLEVNRSVYSPNYFKTGKKCKERWFNHVSPYVRKKNWTAEEDIQLLESCLENQKKWAMIAKAMRGRSQHTVKNRFIFLMARENQLTREQIRLKVKGRGLNSLIQATLLGLEAQITGDEDEQSIRLERLEGSENEELEMDKTSVDMAIEYLDTREHEGPRQKGF